MYISIRYVLVRVPVMDIRIVRWECTSRAMYMRMGVRFPALPGEVVRVLVMLVVHMRMRYRIMLSAARLVHRKAVEVTCSAVRDQPLPAAVFGRMNRIPGTVRAAQSIGVTDHRLVILAIRSPVVARHIYANRKWKGSTTGIRAGQYVVRIVLLAEPWVQLSFFVQSSVRADVISIPLDIAVKIGHVGGDQLTLCVMPRPLADSIARIHRNRADEASIRRRGLSTEIGPPDPIAGTD